MKKRLFYLLPLLALLLVTTIGMTSCEDDKSNEPTLKDYALVINPEPGDSTYAMALADSKGTTSFLNIDENGHINKEDIVYKFGEDLLSITYYDNGLVNSISNGDGSLVFSNYTGNKVDVAIISTDGEFEIIKEHECDVNWDEISVTGSYAPKRANSTFSSDVSDVAIKIGQYIKDFNNNHKTAYFIIDEVADLTDVVNKRNLITVIHHIFNTCEGAVNLVKDEPVIYTEYYDLIDDVKGYTAAGASAGTIIAGPGGAAAGATIGCLFALIKNYGALENAFEATFTYIIQRYDKLEDMFTDAFLAFRKWKDEHNQEGNVDLGVAALSTGMGALKVTLAWNFYADIDLHAIEPNGTHIYYSNQYSYVTGGFLDLDNRYGYPGSAENIYWTTPEDGTYDIYLHYYSPSLHEGEAQCGICNVTILYQGRGQVFKIPMDAVGDTKRVAVIDMPNGTIGATSQWGPKINLHLVPKSMPATTERHVTH